MIIFLCIVVLLVGVLLVLVGFSSYIEHQVEKTLPPRGRFVTIGGDCIHYVEQGSGPPIVIVHGLGGQSLNFAYLSMADLTRGHRVILIDRPGAGYSTRGAQSLASITAQAVTLTKFIETLQLEAPLLVGHSLGGAIALAVALNHPRAIGKLALIAPLSHVEKDPPKVFRRMAIPSPLMRRLIAHTLAIPLSISKGSQIMQVVFGPDPVPQDFGTKGGGLLGLRPRSFYAASTDMLAIPQDLPTMEARYSTLQMPVAVLFGRHDQVLDYRRHGEALAQKVPHAALTLVDGGHMLPVTAGAMTTEWLLAFAGSQRTSPAHA